MVRPLQSITLIMIIIDRILIMIIRILISMGEDGEELGSNAEQVVGRGFLDGSTHCGA